MPDQNELIRINAQMLAMGLRPLVGYVENGSCQTFTIFQDDATKWWTAKVGKREYTDQLLANVLRKALMDGEYVGS